MHNDIIICMLIYGVLVLLHTMIRSRFFCHKISSESFFMIISESHSKNCISGFPDIPVSEVSHRTSESVATTHLIPDMNFTCNASIVGFIVAGLNFHRSPYSTIQIWRNNHAQNSYFNVHNISMNLANGNPICRASWTVQQQGILLSWCILHSNIQFSVQPGDIIGLELPATRSDREIFFTRGGPVTYTFEGQLNSTSTVNLSNNRSYSEFQQLPQIIFNLTAGENTVIHILCNN